MIINPNTNQVPSPTDIPADVKKSINDCFVAAAKLTPVLIIIFAGGLDDSVE